MRRLALIAVGLAGASAVAAGDLQVTGAHVPLSPPGVMTHAAYLTLENTGTQMRSLVGVAADGYAMAHLHGSAAQDGVATMTMLHQLDIAPGQTVTLMPGGLHIMLMCPDGPRAVGDTVKLTFSFANGQDLPVNATITARGYGS